MSLQWRHVKTQVYNSTIKKDIRKKLQEAVNEIFFASALWTSLCSPTLNWQLVVCAAHPRCYVSMSAGAANANVLKVTNEFITLPHFCFLSNDTRRVSTSTHIWRRRMTNCQSHYLLDACATRIWVALTAETIKQP